MSAESDMVRWTREDFDAWPSRKRARTVNSLSGFKSATLVGSADPEGVHNLSVVSSVVHLGSSPAQMGMVLRPPGDDAHTYKNLLATGQCTFNHVGEAWFQQAHQCSARYPANVSEFEETGLTPAFPTQVGPGWKAPAVGEASVRMGLTLLKDLELPNACRLTCGLRTCIRASCRRGCSSLEPAQRPPPWQSGHRNGMPHRRMSPEVARSPGLRVVELSTAV